MQFENPYSIRQWAKMRGIRLNCKKMESLKRSITRPFIEKFACTAAVQAILISPAVAQANTDLPPISPQPPLSYPAQGNSPPGSAQPAPFNFQQFNSAQQNGQPPAPVYPPMQNAPNTPLFPMPIPAGGNENDPYIRGKMLIKQATDLITSGQLDSAIPLLQKSMEFRKIDPTPQFLLGLIYDQKGNTQQALNNYTSSVKKATSLGMDSSQLRINLANTLVKLNYLKEAEFDYRRAIEIDDKNEIAHLNYGRLLLFKGDFAGAFRQLQRAHELMATDPNLPLYEALALKGLGNLEESRLQLQVFLDRAKGINADPRVINMAENLLAGMK